MKVHHLSCGSMCPYGGHLMDGVTPGLGPCELVCHCLLIETENGLVLVDTGFGLEDVRQPERRLASFFRNFNRPKLNEDLTAVRLVKKLGYKPADVRHIVLTHLDFDHAGGITDFPNAQVHLLGAEWQAAMKVDSLLDAGRYRPQQWTNSKKWNKYAPSGESWFGFDSVRDLKGLPPEILLIPLIGHTWGHCGVAVNTDEGWLLHAGDAYFYHGEMNPEHPTCTPGLRAYQKLMEVDRRSRLRNQDRLRNLVRTNGDEVTIFSAHDRTELAQLQERFSTLTTTGATAYQRERSGQHIH